jgi:hypothetical protein
VDPETDDSDGLEGVQTEPKKDDCVHAICVSVDKVQAMWLSGSILERNTSALQELDGQRCKKNMSHHPKLE